MLKTDLSIDHVGQYFFRLETLNSKSFIKNTIARTGLFKETAKIAPDQLLVWGIRAL